jgi:hypothetical protein
MRSAMCGALLCQSPDSPVYWERLSHLQHGQRILLRGIEHARSISQVEKLLAAFPMLRRPARPNVARHKESRHLSDAELAERMSVKYCDWERKHDGRPPTKKQLAEQISIGYSTLLYALSDKSRGLTWPPRKLPGMSNNLES